MISSTAQHFSSKNNKKKFRNLQSNSNINKDSHHSQVASPGASPIFMYCTVSYVFVPPTCLCVGPQRLASVLSLLVDGVVFLFFFFFLTVRGFFFPSFFFFFLFLLIIPVELVSGVLSVRNHTRCRCLTYFHNDSLSCTCAGQHSFLRV
jgi:hypothetical protein